MTKYTKLFSKYLETNSLPVIFSEITGFESLFTEYYSNYEIGFESDSLMNSKLKSYGDLFIPIYKNKIYLLNTYMTSLTSGPVKRKEYIHSLGQVTGYNWVLPVNNTTSTPNQKTQTDSYVNTDNEAEYGFTSDEILRILEHLKNETQNLLYELIQKFKTLFMMIY